MTQIFLLCHEGELPYVVRELRDILFDDPTMQIVGQGSTEKMYMGYVLLEREGELPAACLAELRANADIYLYAIHDPNAQYEEESGEDAFEIERWGDGNEPLPMQL